MTGSKEAFSELDDNVTSTVKFCDGSRVAIFRDVVFDEKAAWDWDSPGMGEAGGFTSTFVVERMVIHGGGDAGEQVPTTPAIEPSTLGAVPSTSGVVSSTVEGVPSTLVAV